MNVLPQLMGEMKRLEDNLKNVPYPATVVTVTFTPFGTQSHLLNSCHQPGVGMGAEVANHGPRKPWPLHRTESVIFWL